MKLILFAVIMTCFAKLAAQNCFIENSDDHLFYNLNGVKIAVIIGEGFEYNEAKIIPDYWKSWGAEVQYIGTSKVVSGHEIIFAERGISIRADTIESDYLLNDFNHDQFNILFFPGGSSPTYLINNYKQKIISIVKSAFNNNKLLTAICHGPYVLLESGIADGKKITGEFKSEKIAEYGAIPSKAIVAEDNNIITGNYPFLETFATAVSEKICAGNIRKEEIAKTYEKFEFQIGIAEHFFEKQVPDYLIKKSVSEAAFTPNDFLLNIYKPWKIIAVKDSELKSDIQTILINNLNSFYKEKGLTEHRIDRRVKNHLLAPVYLVLTMPTNVYDEFIGNYQLAGNTQRQLQLLSAGAFINNLRITSEANGLGCNIVNGLPFMTAENEIKKILKIDESKFVAAIVSLGYPIDKTMVQPKVNINQILKIR